MKVDFIMLKTDGMKYFEYDFKGFFNKRPTNTKNRVDSKKIQFFVIFLVPELYLKTNYNYH